MIFSMADLSQRTLGAIHDGTGTVSITGGWAVVSRQDTPAMRAAITNASVSKAAREVSTSEVFPSCVSRDFFSRVYSTSHSTYEKRLASLGFAGHDNVLDAGCGFGQWSLALAAMNHKVTATDLDGFRCSSVRRLVEVMAIDNLEVSKSSILDLPYSDASFDAVFCYGAVFLVDWRIALRELARVTRPGGVLYCSAVGPGWFIHNLIEGHNDSVGYSTRRMALQSLRATVAYRLTGHPPSNGGQLSISPRQFRRELTLLGFNPVTIAPDGRSGPREQDPPRQFFAGRYYGFTGCYEALAYRDVHTNLQ